MSAVDLKRGYVVERYYYEKESGKRGIQWIVHEVREPGSWHTLRVCKTRSEAFKFLGGLS